jgi:hypothetical protein
LVASKPAAGSVVARDAAAGDDLFQFPPTVTPND